VYILCTYCWHNYLDRANVSVFVCVVPLHVRSKQFCGTVLVRFLNDRPTNALSVSSVFPLQRVFVFLRISLVLFI